ncbi:hypothetical protein L7F22_056313 [Adiantum nelumboides]|nr:hypothetical protein [Adiantum nelumboides]
MTPKKINSKKVDHSRVHLTPVQPIQGRSMQRSLKGPKKTKHREGEIGKSMWKDYWVISLIHKRGGINDDFNKPQKQGPDLWSKVANKLASSYFDLDKASEACRKMWGRVYDKYKADKLHNSMLGNDVKKTCKWFDVVDEYMHDHAHVCVYSHASATGDAPLMDESAPKEEELHLQPTMQKPSTLQPSKTMKTDQQMDELISLAKETGHGILTQLSNSSKKQEALEARRDALENRRMDILETVVIVLVQFMDRVVKK